MTVITLTSTMPGNADKIRAARDGNAALMLCKSPPRASCKRDPNASACSPVCNPHFSPHASILSKSSSRPPKAPPCSFKIPSKNCISSARRRFAEKPIKRITPRKRSSRKRGARIRSERWIRSPIRRAKGRTIRESSQAARKGSTQGNKYRSRRSAAPPPKTIQIKRDARRPILPSDIRSPPSRTCSFLLSYPSPLQIISHFRRKS